MTLAELCESLFLDICRLNRSARQAVNLDYRQARVEIESLFNDMQSSAATEPGLASQYDKVKLALVFFVDSIIAESELPFASQWHGNRLAFELDTLGWSNQAEMAGDQKFFDILDATLDDRSEAATERLSVLYTCIGLGFAGWYAGQGEHLRRKMMECSVRLRREMDADDTSRICPEAYEHVDGRDFVATMGTRLVGIGIALLVLIVIVFAMNLAVYKSTTGELGTLLNGITDNSPAAATVGGNLK